MAPVSGTTSSDKLPLFSVDHGSSDNDDCSPDDHDGGAHDDYCSPDDHDGGTDHDHDDNGGSGADATGEYTTDGELTISRGHDGKDFPAWVQGIDLSGLND